MMYAPAMEDKEAEARMLRARNALGTGSTNNVNRMVFEAKPTPREFWRIIRQLDPTPRP